MDKNIEKIYNIENCRGIAVCFKPNIVQLPNNSALKCAIAKHRTGSLVCQIKADYHSYFNRPLEISEHSLSIEIWGHIVMEKGIYQLAKKVQNKKLWKFHEKINSHCKIIDCGEKSIDNNRKIWDALSWFYPLFYFLL